MAEVRWPFDGTPARVQALVHGAAQVTAPLKLTTTASTLPSVSWSCIAIEVTTG